MSQTASALRARPRGEVAGNEPRLKKTWEQVALALFVAVPLAALAAAVPLA